MDVTDDTFETEVLQRSATTPVVVDLWASWCGPCRTLGPIIETVVAETNGAVVLAKVDIDANPRVGATFKVQSIPAVFALRDRQVVDHFIGALPERDVRTFVQKLVPALSETDSLVAAGDEASLRAALELEPGHTGGVVALAEILAGRGESDEALALLARIPESAETRRVAALARVGGVTAPVDDIESQVVALLPQVKEDPEARQKVVDLLELLGPEDPRTARLRRDLTARLF